MAASEDVMAQQTTMKAVACPKYGPPEVLRLVEVPVPSPTPEQVRIRIHAAGVTMSDIFIRSARVTPLLQIPFRLMMGITKPRAPVVGFVFSGVIDQVGASITRFKRGDEVFCTTGFSLGAYAEYRCMAETDSRKHGCLALKPDNLTHEEATAAAYGGLLALQYSDKGNIEAGDDVLIYGASGTSGTIAVQYAKHLGARVTGVCGPHNVDLVRSLGADEIIDYTKSDAPPSGAQYDFVLDSVGGVRSSPLKKAVRRALKPGGSYVSIDDGDMLLESARLDRIRELVESKAITPVLGHTFPIAEIVEAHRLVQSGHKRGGVAVTIAGQRRETTLSPSR
jgi:NADPH:quinone reductase-like Zn-dependent oxidoreductase